MAFRIESYSLVKKILFTVLFLVICSLASAVLHRCGVIFSQVRWVHFAGAVSAFRRCDKLLIAYGGGQKSNLKTNYWLLITDDYLGGIQDGSQQKSVLCQLSQEKSLHFRSSESTFRWNESISPENKVNLFRNSNAHSDYAYAYAYKICTHMVMRERCWWKIIIYIYIIK
jgi:hypothetical protein